jgi:hypothetical protein
MHPSEFPKAGQCSRPFLWVRREDLVVKRGWHQARIFLGKCREALRFDSVREALIHGQERQMWVSVSQALKRAGTFQFIK